MYFLRGNAILSMFSKLRMLLGVASLHLAIDGRYYDSKV